MTPLIPRNVPWAIGMVAVVVVVSGFFALRRDHAHLDRHLSTEARALDGTSGRVAEDRREVRERLVRTAMEMAGYAIEWHLKPTAFGGGNGSWDGLTLETLGYPSDGDGVFVTTDGTFALRAHPTGTEIVARNEPLGAEVLVEVRQAGGNLRLFVDGRPVEGVPMVSGRTAPRSSAVARAGLQEGAEGLARYIEQVTADDRTGPAPSLGPTPALREMNVEVGPDGVLRSQDGTLRFEWRSSIRGVVFGSGPGGPVRVEVRVPDLPRARRSHDHGVVPEPPAPPAR